MNLKAWMISIQDILTLKKTAIRSPSLPFLGTANLVSTNLLNYKLLHDKLETVMANKIKKYSEITDNFFFEVKEKIKLLEKNFMTRL